LEEQQLQPLLFPPSPPPTPQQHLKAFKLQLLDCKTGIVIYRISRYFFTKVVDIDISSVAQPKPLVKLIHVYGKTTSFGHVTPHLLYLPPCFFTVFIVGKNFSIAQHYSRLFALGRKARASVSWRFGVWYARKIGQNAKN
jgi:hypothetical protein